MVSASSAVSAQKASPAEFFRANLSRVSGKHGMTLMTQNSLPQHLNLIAMISPLL